MFQTASVIQKLTTLGDGTTRLTVDCQELKPEESTQLFTLLKKSGWFLFSANPIKKEDVPDEAAPEFKNDKSKSLRLRNTLFVFWKECTNQAKPFNTFYDEWMEGKIEQIKESLPQ